MPCPLTSGADYPDYLKSILKEIEAGNDENLKACACSLKTPTTNGVCPILGEDNKVGAFPFCLTIEEDTSSVGDGTQYPIKLTLAQAMNLYWNSKKFTNTFSAIVSWSYHLTERHCQGAVCSGGGSDTEKYTQHSGERNISITNEVLDPLFEFNEQKYLVCPNQLYSIYDYDHGLAFCQGCEPDGLYCSDMKYKDILAAMSFFEGVGGDKLKIIKKDDQYWFYPKVIFLLGKYGIYVSNDPSLLVPDYHEKPELPIEEVSVGLYFNDEKLNDNSNMKLYVLKLGNLKKDCKGDYDNLSASFSIDDIKITSWR
jgi:hypothetical protein